MSQTLSNTPSNNEVSLRDFHAFKDLSDEAIGKLNRDSQLLSYRTGQPLTEENTMPVYAQWVLQGQCRMLGVESEKLSTLAKLGPGSCVGLASLLRAQPCESINASSSVITVAVPSDLIVELYKTEESFQNWCNNWICPSEIAKLVQVIFQGCATSSENSVRSRLAEAVRKAYLITSSAQWEQVKAEKSGQNYFFYTGSGNIDQPIGTLLAENEEFPQSRGVFQARVLGLPKEIVETSSKKKSQLHELGTGSDLKISKAPDFVERSGIKIGQKDLFEDFKLIEAKGELEETLACFQMLASQFKLPFRRDSIEKILRDSIRRGQKPNIQLCGQIAASLGLHVVAAKTPSEMGTRLQIPSMVLWNGKFAIATQSDSDGLILASPSSGYQRIDKNNLSEEFPEGIELLLMEKTINTPEQRFGPSWFMPAIKKYKRVLTQVLIASLVVQLFGLANPLLIQIIIDKVISQRSLDTLQVLGVALIVVTLLEGVLGSLRTFLFAETTNRLDQRLGAEVIDHLLRLPLGYFDKRPVGELGTRIAELEKIRNFLTGTALTTVIDAAFSVIYIIVMAFYSWLLTIVALVVLPIQVGITLLGAPLFRRQFRQAAEQNAKTQSHLVEVLTGIQTVKAQNVEVISRWKWQDYYSQYIARTFEKIVTGTAVNESSQVLQKLSQLLVLWVGATLVLKGQLTLGQLIAFRIISGYVTQPLLRLSTIWQSVQELKVSFERLADVIDTPVESNQADQAKIPLPPIKGDVHFESIDFAFDIGQTAILKKVNLDVKAGTFLGIVGQSGSGKSTLMKLLPRLYSPSKGRIKIDGYDIDKIELYSLRRQVGIVPQDPLLFSGSVAENIALTNPDADSDAIVRAAKLACAHDFIMQLPLGYSTPVGERGGSLSGGQRQRIAIARTLLSNPKLLVMDEATSALDYETERKVCDNLLENLTNCTVFFITHRLSTIKRANRIIMMHQGAIVEEGDHETLMKKNGRYYALYRQQEAS